MTVIEPGGAPDWQGRGAVVSATLLNLTNQVWANGSDNYYDFDMGPWGEIVISAQANMAASGFVVEVDFFADAAMTQIIAETGAACYSQSTLILVLPVVARYMRIHSSIAPANPVGATYDLQAWATSATHPTLAQFLKVPLFEVVSNFVNANTTITVVPTQWSPGRYILTVVTTAVAWTVQVEGVDYSGNVQNYPVKLTNAIGQPGVPYPFVAHRRQPTLVITNSDSVSRPFWVIASPDA